MSKTTYAGLNYAGFTGTNQDKETGIHYGVISQNSICPEALPDIYDGPHSTDLYYKLYCEEMRTLLSKGIHDALDDTSVRARDIDAIVESACDELENSLGDSYQNDEVCPHYDDGKYVIGKCLDFDFFVTKSPYYTFAAYCSPCCPGAGNLDSYCPDGPKTYCLGPEWFDDEKAPYPCFEVKTEQRIPDGYQEENDQAAV